MKKYVNKSERRRLNMAAMGITDAMAEAYDLNGQEMDFALEMVTNGLDGEAAYRAVYRNDSGVTSKTIMKKVALLLERPGVREIMRVAVERYMAKSIENLDARLLDAYTRRAFYDVSMFFFKGGEPKPLESIPEEWRIVIDGYERRFYGKDADVEVLTMKLPDRDRMMSKLGEYMAILKGGAQPAKLETTDAKEVERSVRGDADALDYSQMSEEELKDRIESSRKRKA